MTLTAHALDALWLQTEVPLDAGATAVCTTGIVVAGTDVVVGRDHLGRRHLMVPMSPNDSLRINLRAAGLSVSAPRELLHSGSARFYLDIYCTRQELRGVFTRLAEELVREAARPVPQAARRCAEALDNWRSLFGVGAGTFGRQQSLGLIGELRLLHRLLLKNQASLSTWTGPLGGIHDFRSGNAAIEVKTTVRTHGLFHSISSVDQLAPPPGGRLGFFSLRLESVPEGRISLGTLLADVRSAGVSAADFSRLLEEVGLVEGIHPELEDEKFEIRDERFYEVGSGFPRIIPTTLNGERLPAGVLGLSYEIDLTGEPPTPLDPNSIDSWLTSFACPT